MFAFQLLQTFQRAVLRRAFKSRTRLIVRVIFVSYTCGCALSDSRELRTPLRELILKCALRLSYIVTVRKVRVTLVLLALTAMSLYDINISSCTRCRTREVNWSSGLVSIGRLVEYTCTSCLDSDRLGTHRAAFLTLYQKLHKALPQTCLANIYAFTYPGCYNQWKKLNWYNYMQRRATLKFFLAGAPWTNNWLHDLHRKLQRQGNRTCLWKGKVYRTSTWNIYTDLYSVICDYLI